MLSVALTLLLAAGSCVNAVDLIQPDSMAVQPGQSLTISCQVSGYSLTDNSYATGWIRQREGKPMDWIFYMWGGGGFYKNEALKNKFSYSRDTSAGTVTLTGQNLQPEDTAVYYCVRYNNYYFDYWGKGTMVTVTSATPKAPTVFPLTPCGSGTGNTVTLGCLATDFTPSTLTFSWNKDGAAMSGFIQYPPVLKNNFYTGVSQIQVSREDWNKPGTSFTCVAGHSTGNVQIIVPPPRPSPGVFIYRPTLRVLTSSNEENEVSYSCFAKDFSPKDHEIKWLKNNEDVTNKLFEVRTLPIKESKNENGTLYSAASFLTVPSKDWNKEDVFTCQFKGRDKTNNPYFESLNATYQKCNPDQGCPEADVDIEIIGPTPEDMLSYKAGKVKCQVTQNKPAVTKIWWEDESGNEMVSFSPTKKNGSPKSTQSLSIDITFDEWSRGFKPVCWVEHSLWLEPEKKPFERNVGGQTQRPTVFMLPAVEHTRQNTTTLTCYVKDFFPKEVFVSWLVDDEEIDSKHKFYTTNAVGSQGSYSAYGHLLLPLEEWERNDVVYSCVVHHESVANTTNAIVRSIGYKTFQNNNLVNLNLNVPQTCEAQ